MLVLNSLKDAERFVKQQQERGSDIRWDGWDIIVHRPDARASANRHGAFRNGGWGFDNRSVVTQEGKWNIDSRNVKRSRRTGS